MAADHDEDKDKEPERVSEPSPARFDDPVEFIHREHDRQIVVLGAIERLADEPAADDSRETAAYALGYLERELPLHVEDEERDLFPRLAQRVTADDGFDDILAALQGEHEADDAYCRALMADLHRLAEGELPADPLAFAHQARAFVGFQRRHLAWENSVLLPLARRRLEASDLAELRRAMAARRGVTLSP
jgi:hemerythrin-like domain-containing protein